MHCAPLIRTHLKKKINCYKICALNTIDLSDQSIFVRFVELQFVGAPEAEIDNELLLEMAPYQIFGPSTAVDFEKDRANSLSLFIA